MRETIPRAKVIDTGFRVLEKRFDRVRRSINTEAARSMRAGDYDAVQRWMGVGKNVADFAARLDAFAMEWKRLVKATRIAAGTKTKPATTTKLSATHKRGTSASRFYESAMKALVGRGGEATSDQLLQDLEATLLADLSEVDLKILPRGGTPRWHRTVERARRDCVREGWIEKRRDKVWKLTENGKQLATPSRSATRA